MIELESIYASADAPGLRRRLAEVLGVHMDDQCVSAVLAVFQPELDRAYREIDDLGAVIVDMRARREEAHRAAARANERAHHAEVDVKNLRSELAEQRTRADMAESQADELRKPQGATHV